MPKSAVSNAPPSKKNGRSRGTSTYLRKSDLGLAKGASRTRKETQHVVGHDGGWVVRSARTGKFVTRTYPIKSEAIDAGRRIARTTGGEVLVHGRNGQIFQHLSVPSTRSESLYRKLIRASHKKTTPVRTTKKSTGAKSSRKTAGKKK